MIRNSFFSILILVMVAMLPYSGQAAREGIVVHLEAKPSDQCFPASALQFTELRQDFSKVCPECVITPNGNQKPDFDVVVEDPESSWVVSIYDSEGDLLKKMEWSGSLQTGLAKAVQFMRVEFEN